MTGRETVAAALIAQMRDGACEWAKLSEADQEFGLGLADAAFASIVLVAAERGWHLRPDEATDEMAMTGIEQSWAEHDWAPDVYRTMLADPTAQFEWDK